MDTASRAARSPRARSSSTLAMRFSMRSIRCEEATADWPPGERSTVLRALSVPGLYMPLDRRRAAGLSPRSTLVGDSEPKNSSAKLSLAVSQL